MAAMAATTQASVNARERRRVAGDSATAAAAARPITASTRISAPHAGHAAASCARVSGRAASVTAPLTTSAPATAAYTPHGTRATVRCRTTTPAIHHPVSRATGGSSGR